MTTSQSISDQLAPGESSKIHFAVLDSWRGVAALLVALFHLNILSAISSLDFIRNAYLFVDFFFVLSGFVITHSYGDRLENLADARSFVIRRFGRLWPLHAVVLLAMVLIESGRAISAARGAVFVNPPFTGATALHSIFVNLGFGQSFGIERQLTWNSPAWSICAEFWTYLVFAGALLVGQNWLRHMRFATETLLAALLIGSVVALVLLSPHGIDATYDCGFIRCVYGFLVGHFTYRLWRATAKYRFMPGVAEIAVLIAAAYYVSTVGHSESTFFAPIVFAVVVFVFAFEVGPVSRLLMNRGSAWLGRISYSIYMWQAFIIFNLVDRPVSMIEKLTGHSLTTVADATSPLGSEAGKLIVLGGQILPIVATLLFVALVIFVASVSYYLIEQPGQRLFARLAKQSRRPSEPVVAPSLGSVHSARGV